MPVYDGSTKTTEIVVQCNDDAAKSICLSGLFFERCGARVDTHIVEVYKVRPRAHGAVVMQLRSAFPNVPAAPGTLMAVYGVSRAIYTQHIIGKSAASPKVTQELLLSANVAAWDISLLAWLLLNSLTTTNSLSAKDYCTAWAQRAIAWRMPSASFVVCATRSPTLNCTGLQGPPRACWTRSRPC
jgi:hypothetical protein